MRLTFTAVVAAMSAFTTITIAESDEIAKSMMFANGKTSTVVQGSVVRGDRDVYTLRVHAGQVMSANVVAVEHNAAFSIYAPNSEVPLPGTEEEKDAAAWSGTVQTSGPYRIIVGGTRGNATYKLKVSVK